MKYAFGEILQELYPRQRKTGLKNGYEDVKSLGRLTTFSGKKTTYGDLSIRAICNRVMVQI